MSLSVGTRLGTYELLAPIGASGIIEVYRARDTQLGREVAIKVLPASFSQDVDQLRRFEQEARSASALNHPNITAVYDLGSYEGARYVVSELLEGETLRAVLVAGRLAARKALDYAIQIARGLAAAHERGIVHRNLRPEDLFVTKAGGVKILDFGFPRLTPNEAEGSEAVLTTATAGTEASSGYMSPEQARGLAADRRTDIFSFGAILYEMLSGQRAFYGDSAADTIRAILREDPPDLSVYGVSPAIERIVRRCLQKDREQRLQSARELVSDLEALSGQSAATQIGGTSSIGPVGKTDLMNPALLLSRLRRRSLEKEELLLRLKELDAALLPARKVFRMAVEATVGLVMVLIFAVSVRSYPPLVPHEIGYALLLMCIPFLLVAGYKSREQEAAAGTIDRLEAALETLTTSAPYQFMSRAADERGKHAAHGDAVLITVHGVKSYNEGFDVLAGTLQQALPGLRVFHCKYDEGTIRKLSPEKRANAHLEVYYQLAAASSTLNPGDRVYLVAHSFGTIATVQALQSMIPKLMLDSVVFLGCALPRMQNWSWLGHLYGQERRNGTLPLLNVVRPFDLVLPFARFVGGGDSGAKGFVPLGWRNELPIETFKDGGHTHYVNDVEEIASFIRGQRPPLKSRSEWKAALPRWKRWALGLRNQV